MTKAFLLFLFHNIHQKREENFLSVPADELTFLFLESTTSAALPAKTQPGESVLEIHSAHLFNYEEDPRFFEVQNVLTDFCCSNPFISFPRTYPDQLES